MTRFVIRLKMDGRTEEFVRLGYSSHKLRRAVERYYPGVEVLDVYPL